MRRRRYAEIRRLRARNAALLAALEWIAVYQPDAWNEWRAAVELADLARAVIGKVKKIYRGSDECS